MPPPDPTLPPSEAALKLLYELTQAEIDKQQAVIDGLTSRAQQILGWATLVLTVSIGLRTPHRGVLNLVLTIVALALFLRISWWAFKGWRTRRWRLDPDPAALWTAYRSRSETWLRHQV